MQRGFSLERHEVFVLRLGHRYIRDIRISTHVGLVARAFGAVGVYYYNVEKQVLDSLKKVVDRWGGPFHVEEITSWKKMIQEWKDSSGIVVHLTMYGEPVDTVLNRIRASKRILVVVGAEKVPSELYRMTDYNVAIGSQPHSEVAALAVFLDRFFEGRELGREFQNAKIKVVPSSRGKRLVTLK
jgi:tRNA (cytidine56-2'-O)-methyltransferase